MVEKSEEKETKNDEELRTKEQLESRDRKKREKDGEKMSERAESCAGNESERGCEFIRVERMVERKKGRREGAADASRQG